MTIAVSTAAHGELERFICCKVEKDELRERETVFAAPGGREAVVRQLIGLEVDLLIAGLLPPSLEEMIGDAGISVISGIRQVADAPDLVLKKYLDGTLDF